MAMDDDLQELVENKVFSPDFAKKQQEARDSNDNDDDGRSSSSKREDPRLKNLDDDLKKRVKNGIYSLDFAQRQQRARNEPNKSYSEIREEDPRIKTVDNDDEDDDDNRILTPEGLRQERKERAKQKILTEMSRGIYSNEIGRQKLKNKGFKLSEEDEDWVEENDSRSDYDNERETFAGMDVGPTSESFERRFEESQRKKELRFVDPSLQDRKDKISENARKNELRLDYNQEKLNMKNKELDELEQDFEKNKRDYEKALDDEDYQLAEEKYAVLGAISQEFNKKRKDYNQRIDRYDELRDKRSNINENIQDFNTDVSAAVAASTNDLLERTGNQRFIKPKAQSGVMKKYEPDSFMQDAQKEFKKRYEDKYGEAKGSLWKGLSVTPGAVFDTISDRFRGKAEDSAMKGKDIEATGFEVVSRIGSTGEFLTGWMAPDKNKKTLKGRDLAQFSRKKDFEYMADVVDAVDILVGVGAGTTALNKAFSKNANEIAKIQKSTGKLLDDLNIPGITKKEGKQFLKLEKKAAKSSRRGFGKLQKEIDTISKKGGQGRNFQSGWIDNTIQRPRKALYDIDDKLIRTGQSPFADIEDVRKTKDVFTRIDAGKRTDFLTDDTVVSNFDDLSKGRKATISTKDGKQKINIFDENYNRLKSIEKNLKDDSYFNLGRQRSKNIFQTEQKFDNNKLLSRESLDLDRFSGASFQGKKNFRSLEGARKSSTSQRMRAWDNYIEKNLDETIPRQVRKKELKFVDAKPSKQLDNIDVSGRKMTAQAKGTSKTKTLQNQNIFFELSNLQKKNSLLGQEFFPNGIFPKRKVGMFSSKKGFASSGSPSFGTKRTGSLFDDVFSTKNFDNFGKPNINLPKSFKNLPSGNIKLGGSNFGKGISKGFGVTKGLNSLLNQNQNFATGNKFVPMNKNIDKNINKNKENFDFKIDLMSKLDSFTDLDKKPRLDTFPKFDDLEIPKPKMPEPRVPIGGVPGIKQFTGFGAITGNFKPSRELPKFRRKSKTKTGTETRFLKDLWNTDLKKKSSKSKTKKKSSSKKKSKSKRRKF